jgi:hypothetical protein
MHYSEEESAAIDLLEFDVGERDFYRQGHNGYIVYSDRT